jgi:hypothetical protein
MHRQIASPGRAAMQTFIIKENIHRYHEMPAGSLDPAQRRMVEELLAGEEAKLAELERLQRADRNARRG